MIFLATALLALLLIFAPIYAALPDDPTQVTSSLWTSALCTAVFVAALAAIYAAWRGSAFRLKPTRPETAFLILLGLAFLSIPVRLMTQHGTAYFGPMLHGWALLAADFALFALARRLAASKACLYGLALAAVVGSAWVADLGVQEHIAHLRAGDATARTFGTSTPDYLAGYFVLLLPVTLALLLTTPSRHSLTPLLRTLASLVLTVVLCFQLITLLTTSSRFGLLSLAVALIIFALALYRAVRTGFILDKVTRLILGGIGVILVLGGLAFAKPVLARLHNLHDNSAAFRVWTWRGCLRMVEANPILGTGIGTWVNLYPRYALTGFTRVAHNSYLQMADECGVLGLLAFLAVLGLLVVSLTRGLAKASPASDNGFFPTDSRLLLCGLLAALAGGLVQNLIDSDWNIFFLGATFWGLAGLGAGIAEINDPARETKPKMSVLTAVGSVAAACAMLMGTQAVGAAYAQQAASQLGSDPGGAAQIWGQARAWDPLNGRYPSDQGYKALYVHSGDLLQSEAALETAVALEPNEVNYRRLGTILQAAGRLPDALAAYRNGLNTEPNSVEMLATLEKLSPSAQSLDYARRLADLELTPVGTARALGESVEPRFALGTAALGDEYASTDPRQAMSYYDRAARLLEQYISEGAGTNAQQQLLTGGRPDVQTDTELRALYQHVLTAWSALAPPDQKAALVLRQHDYGQKFDLVLQQETKPGML